MAFCGVRGIRTPDTLLGYTRFPGVPLQPLEHHSMVVLRCKITYKIGVLQVLCVNFHIFIFFYA